MRKLARMVGLLVVVLVLPGSLCAQGTNLGTPLTPTMAPLTLPTGTGSPSGLGPLVSPPGQLLGSDSQSNQQASDPPLNVTDSFVSVIDGALPRNMFIVRFDALYDIRQPTRAEYMFAKGGTPNSAGFRLAETKMDYQELLTHAEYALVPWFSAFMEVPFRWLNPDVNANQRGFAGMNYGFKICTWSSNNFIATILFRIYQPPTDPSTLGNNHWSLEPGLLAAYRITDKILLEGECRYWTAIGGSDFAGDLIRYGLGISYGQRNPSGFWFMPVAECVGWTILSGQTMIASSPTSYIIENARNQTIANGYLGLRLGYGANIDFYLGYGRCFTGDQWQRDFYRAELRFVY